MSKTADPHVVILMAVYNGEDHLEEQLNSIAAQDHSNWMVVASDDGSDDRSREILEQFAASGRLLTCMDGPGRGGTKNFQTLIRAWRDHAGPDSWIAFSDQDDVWLPDRLSRGIAALRAGPAEHPALYCSRSWIADETLATRRLSVSRPRPLGFRNALVQNVAGGNTILLNPAAASLVTAAAAESGKVVVHDWWIYQLVSGAGGRLVHDDQPTLLYRQHAVNQIGANDTTRARIMRIGMLLQGHFRDWNTINIAALLRSAHRLTPESRQILEEFAAIRGRSLPKRLLSLWRLGLYRQHRASTAALWLSAILKRM